MDGTGPLSIARADVVSPVSKSPAKSSTAGFLFAVCAPMFVALAISKAIDYAPLTSVNLSFPVKCGIVVFQDALFVMAWAAIGMAGLWLVRAWPLATRIAQVIFVLGSVLHVFYGVAFIWIFDELRMPLTYPLLRFAGGFEEVRSSIAPLLSITLLGSLGGAVIGYLIIVYLLLRARWQPRPRVWLSLLLLVLIWFPFQNYAYNRWIAGGAKDALAQSPHWAMIKSCLVHLSGRDESIDGAAAVPAAADDSDFESAAARQAPHHKGPEIKNVIVVVLESTGTQFLNLYGSPCDTTPCLNAEAGNSLVFTNFYSNAGYTLHSMMPLVLSIYPGAGWTIYSSDYPHLSGTSAAQVLHERGYRTAFMTSQDLAYRNIFRFFENRGFDEVLGAEQFLQRGRGTRLSSWGIDDAALFDEIIGWIQASDGKPFYVMAWTQQTHHPYQLAPGQTLLNLIGAHSGAPDDAELNRYLNAVRATDQQLGRLFTTLRASGLADSTLVVVTGDHGEAFGFPHRWRFHGTTLYQEAMNVPLILWNPRLFHPGTRNDNVGAHIDLNPTIFDLLGLPAPDAWQGESLLDRTRPQRCYFSCNTGNLLLGLRDGPEKYIFNATLARQELYDLRTDPTEQTNLASKHLQQCAAYRQRLIGWMKFEKGKLDSLATAGEH
jgi:phosphoglycerol transferase MdoB-like AlkP superfamily enzyme